ncbi:tRNA-dihydrouridine synthase [Trema orientale]|uniref:tRNA-dihydrouridine(16/17) synthase [NAD(P)(+)] n=1 Tax=Trema orientale TaxID=63057 RepID=A0A2P5D1L4_TREOI|nr:tRNA-dihydrouridine synthase [Trema orientale]
MGSFGFSSAALSLSLLNSPLSRTRTRIRIRTPNSRMATTLTETTVAHRSEPPPGLDGDDDLLCCDGQKRQRQEKEPDSTLKPSFCSESPSRSLSLPAAESRIERAWAHWTRLGRPKLIVAPMVDNSELPFRMLCRKYGAEAAYTPMLHSRIFTETEKYRNQEFTTCEEDRPLFVQFCANDPDILLEAARRVEPYCDYVDINLGCPQRIARRGNYGAFLMDNLPLVKSLVQKLAHNLEVPVSCKIRLFPNLQDTINYARMLEDAGCSLLAVHGRTRDEKDGKKIRANWSSIKAVKDSVRIPVLANGNIRHMDDVHSCLAETGVEGVLSAESLLENPALFAGFRTAEWVVGSEDSSKDAELDQADLLVEYLKLCEQYPVPWRMIRAHVHKMLGEWFRIQPQVRDDLNAQSKLTFEFLYGLVDRLRELGVRIPLYQKDGHVAEVSADSLAASNS